MGLHLGGKGSPRVFALLLALTVATALVPSFGHPQRTPKKLSQQDVIDLLTGDVPSSDVADQARKSGISFQVTDAAAKQIHDAGGTDDLIRVLRSLAPHAATPPAVTPRNPPVTTPPVLMIESSPGQTQVYVDDEPVGSTSQQGRLKMTRLTAGDHRVRISLGGYQDHEETVTLTAGQMTTVAATLVKAETAQISPPPVNPPQEVPTVNPAQSGYLGVQAMPQQPAGARGVVVSGVMPGGPADAAGLKANDTILTVNGRPVTTPQELKASLASHQVGEAVQITWNNGRNNVTRQIRLTAAPAPGQATLPPSSPPTLTNMPHTGLVSFNVGHDHGPNGQGGNNYCVGVMQIGNGMIYYKGTKGTNGVHTYEIPLNTVKEARRNNVYLVAIGAFHLKLNRGTNYNFVVINQQGQYQPPDPVLNAIDAAMGR